jgi:hypothetical protein
MQQKREFITQEVVKISATHLTIFNRVLVNDFARPRLSRENLNNTTNHVKGVLSSGASRSLGNALEFLLMLAPERKIKNPVSNRLQKHRATFITLTLPSNQIHCDQTVKNVCLNNFLDIMRKTHYLEKYVWKAETQKNGNLHFHIATDEFYHWDVIRNAWQSSLELLGYMSRYDHNWQNMKVPCSDIQEARSITDSIRYLRKYMSKNGNSRPICGAQWDAAQDLKKYKPPTPEIDSFLHSELNNLVKSAPDRVKVFEYATIVNVTINELYKAGYRHLVTHYHNNLHGIEL